MLHTLSLTDEATDNPVSLLRIFPPHRLHKLRLTIKKTLSQDKYEELESYLLCSMPELTYLDLVITKTKGTPWKLSPTRTPSRSIKDISFCVLETHRTKLPARLIYNTPALESCSLSWPTFETLPPFNSRLRSLELTFKSMFTTNQRMEKLETMTLEYLEHLKVLFEDSEHMLSVLKMIRAPSLLRMEIIETNLGRPECDDLVFPKASDLEILAYSHHLQHLVLYFHHTYDIPPLPALKTLTSCLMNWTDLFSLDLPELSALSLWCTKPQTQMVGKIGESKGFDNPHGLSQDDDRTTLVTYMEALSKSKFNYITELSFDNPCRGRQPHAAVLSHFCDFLAMLPSVQRLAFPPVTFDLIPYIDLLTERVASDPTFCPQLEEISNRDYPSSWSRFVQTIYLRNISALLSVDGCPRKIQVLRFWRLPHPSIIAQLSTSMSAKSATKSLWTPNCPEACWPQRPLLKSARPRRGTTPCFMCHTARLETGCLHQRSRDHHCDRWIGSSLLESLWSP